MQLKKRVNLKIYLPLSILCTTVSLLFANNSVEIGTILGIYFASLINQYMLLYTISVFILSTEVVKTKKTKKTKKMKKFKMVFFFIAKMAVILVALTIGVHFMGNRIIIPVLNYVMHIFILGFSLKRDSSSLN